MKRCSEIKEDLNADLKDLITLQIGITFLIGMLIREESATISRPVWSDERKIAKFYRIEASLCVKKIPIMMVMKGNSRGPIRE